MGATRYNHASLSSSISSEEEAGRPRHAEQEADDQAARAYAGRPRTPPPNPRRARPAVAFIIVGLGIVYILYKSEYDEITRV